MDTPLRKYHFNREMCSMQEVSLTEIRKAQGVVGLCVCAFLFCPLGFIKGFSLQGFAFVSCLPTHNLPPVSHAWS